MEGFQNTLVFDCLLVRSQKFVIKLTVRSLLSSAHRSAHMCDWGCSESAAAKQIKRSKTTGRKCFRLCYQKTIVTPLLSSISAS